ncbi:hypothetical protein [Myroides sp. DF42-4-2]|uniref:hypothetical protein n=1 Tax=unclassified Myroides TaxID=2642485 RepID=UPI002576FE37|nr:hypothetical protein [Myroides sp. DF42-4-2]
MGQVVRGSRRIGLRERIKSVRIQATGTQFQSNTPSTITLKAVAQNFEAISYAWYKGAGAVIVGTNQNFVVANNQVATVETYRVVVKNNQNQEYEDSISISKVIDGPQGRPGQLPIQREWKVGDIYRNNDEVVDYIYHRATDSWWKLKPGYNNVVAGIYPSNAFIQLNSLEQLAVNLLIAENANLGGLIFKENKLISQDKDQDGNPIISIDGKTGKVVFTDGVFRGAIQAQHGWFGNLFLSGNALSNQGQGLVERNNMLLWVQNVLGTHTSKKVLIGGYSQEQPDVINQGVGAIKVESKSALVNTPNPAIELSSHGPSNANYAINVTAGAYGGFNIYALVIGNSDYDFIEGNQYVKYLTYDRYLQAGLLLCHGNSRRIDLKLPNPGVNSNHNGKVLYLRTLYDTYMFKVRVDGGSDIYYTANMQEVEINRNQFWMFFMVDGKWYAQLVQNL